ncbi:hypothetical protein BSKO_03854 [Bryopsis sp. KO-2023]|nr:hypothetical protein BSKO_03854 [Bryopsis sp. KO-2023]
MEMSKQALLGICKEHQLYRTASLNDKLYCNFKGFRQITPALAEYSGLRALFLEGNALETIAGMPALSELRCLYLQQNLIGEITDLEALEQLDTLNISNNRIAVLQNISCCTKLTTLLISHNLLSDVESIRHLSDCGSLRTLDMQHNKIDDPQILEVLKAMPDLKCLYLKGNPVVSKIKNYRKTVISSLPSLVYLDDRPVFEKERRTSDAWAVGGVDAERQERDKIREEEMEKDKRNFEYLQKIREEGWRKRRERLGLPPGNTDPYFDDLSDTEYELKEEPEALVKARKDLEVWNGRQRDVESENMKKAREVEDAKVYLESMKENQRVLVDEFATKLTHVDEVADCGDDLEGKTGSSPFSVPGHGVTSVVCNSDSD